MLRKLLDLGLIFLMGHITDLTHRDRFLWKMDFNLFKNMALVNKNSVENSTDQGQLNGLFCRYMLL